MDVTRLLLKFGITQPMNASQLLKIKGLGMKAFQVLLYHGWVIGEGPEAEARAKAAREEIPGKLRQFRQAIDDFETLAKELEERGNRIPDAVPFAINLLQNALKRMSSF